jgi:L-amino acid N-acyltransferase YncA
VAATAVSSRCVYAGVIEHSVYVHPDTRGRGIAAALLDALIGSTDGRDLGHPIRDLPRNTAGLHLHAKAGFRTIGTRHHIGQHHGQWRDVVHRTP